MAEQGLRPKHHPVFECFPAYRPFEAGGWRVNFLGVRQRAYYDNGYLPNWPGAVALRDDQPFDPAADLKLSPVSAERRSEVLPALNEEYFEWVDVLEAVADAKTGFTMIELGAGYGRWLVNAAVALRQIKAIPCYLVAVEAEPTHFRWIKTHFKDNGLDPKKHRLVKAAVTNKEGSSWFCLGKPNEWYGQYITEEPRWIDRAKVYINKHLRRRDIPQTINKVKAITLSRLLTSLDRVDLVDIDIQGAELDVVRSSVDLLTSKVRRIHIGTHNHEVEAGLKDIFTSRHWVNINDFPCFQPSETRYGVVEFGDGVQTWINSTVRND
ncbi:MAG: FkbM family methyltransferase [Armatimonadetes bacterium]|nr:FkbM family methyltransferase [Armatimonadota bacterium]